MIKQIQLRGISRTPSDRMSEDGGLSESLNMYMDTTESAPALVPKDVTEDLCLPTDLGAERIFIHKTANYENTIVVQSDSVVAYTPDIEDKEPVKVLDLAEGEDVSDITSVGNTLIISTSTMLYYVLYKDRVYSLLSNDAQFPYINFNAIINKPIGIEIQKFSPYDVGANAEEISINWNKKNAQKENDSDLVKEINQEFWKQYDEEYNSPDITDFFSPLVVRYAIELYDSSLLSSMPILIKPSLLNICASATHESGFRVEQNQYPVPYSFNKITFSTYDFYIQAKIDSSFDWERWLDLKPTICIYASRQYKDFANRNSSSIHDIKETNYGPDSDGEEYNRIEASIRFDDTEDVMGPGLLLQSSQCSLVKKISVFDDAGRFTDEFKELQNGMDIKRKDIPEHAIEFLSKDDMKHYAQMSENLSTYNNKLVLVQPSQKIDYDYNRLTSYDNVETTDTKPDREITYDITYLLRGYRKDNVIKKRFVYYKNENVEERIYAFQIFPDARAYKMIVEATVKTGTNTSKKFGKFDMSPHPYLDCAYYLGDISNELLDLCDLSSVEDFASYNIDIQDNKLVVSNQDNPLFFPIESRYTFQSKVIGIAIATAALSQGQFGQFPLYVFTEDGIWTMETSADGSFISQKPLSREVCINPDSICSIDNAVVFVTSKAVMMIQGSQVLDISSRMNGRHYKPNDSALNLIGKQEGFDILINAVSNDDPFMSFMKDAKVAYDYTGQRLVFISPSNNGFQYIYKVDTQTWHKVAFSGFDLNTPINSYPECLVMGEQQGNSRVLSLSTVLDASTTQDTAKGILITRPFDLGMPDVFKSIKNIKIRGDYDKGNVNYILQGSDDGKTFYTMSSLRGKSWKMFRIFILADLEPTERISWIDIDFEPRYNNRLR